MKVRPLKGFGAFSAVLRRGDRTSVGPVSITVGSDAATGNPGTLYLGVTVSKRTAPKASVRTRIRRLLREAVRSFAVQNNKALSEAHINTMVLIWRNAPSKPSLIHFQDVEPVVHQAIHKAIGKVDGSAGGEQ